MSLTMFIKAGASELIVIAACRQSQGIALSPFTAYSNYGLFCPWEDLHMFLSISWPQFGYHNIWISFVEEAESKSCSALVCTSDHSLSPSQYIPVFSSVQWQKLVTHA